MVKIDNILSSQNWNNYLISNTKTDNENNQISIQKDSYIKTNSLKDERYSFAQTSNQKTTEKTVKKLPLKVSDSLPAASKFIIKSTKNQDSYPIEFTGNLTFQLVQYINKDVQKQIDILNKYNLSKVNRLIKSIDISQLV